MGRMFRLLRADEIECRVQKCTKDGASLLLYKDARCDMNILDETVGALNWQRDHKELKDVIYGGVGINANYEDVSKPPLWIWKWDAGAESYTEKEKGESSDSFKRACVNAGIGRELYTAPFIWIKDVTEPDPRNADKFICKERFSVSIIEYENGVISYLIIRNRRGEVVYQFGTPLAEKTPRRQLIVYCKEHDIDLNEVASKYDINKNTADDVILNVLEDLKNGQ